VKRASGSIESSALVAGIVVLAFEAHAVVQSMIVGTSGPVGGGNPIIFGLADCPVDASAVGGGAEVKYPFQMTVTESAPTFGGFGLSSRADGVHGAPDGWSSVALSNPGQLDSLLKTAVLCSSSVTPQTVVASSSIAIGGTGSATALCPEGSVALSGGVSGATTARVLAFEPTFAVGALSTLPLGAGPAPNGWTATLRNDGNSAFELKVAAICASSVTVASDVTTFGVSGGLDIGAGNRACPADGLATGGAFGSPTPTAMALIANAPSLLLGAPNGVNPAPTSWSAVVRLLEGEGVIARFAAVCVPEPSPACADLAAFCAVVATRVRSARRKAESIAITSGTLVR
jgi:hypothetical protein